MRIVVMTSSYSTMSPLCAMSCVRAPQFAFRIPDLAYASATSTQHGRMRRTACSRDVKPNTYDALNVKLA